MRLGDLSENIRRTGRHPFAANQPVGPGNADQIELVQMFLQPDREILVENLDVVMAEDEIFPPALRETAGVAIGQRSGIGDPNDLVRLILQQMRIVRRHR